MKRPASMSSSQPESTKKPKFKPDDHNHDDHRLQTLDGESNFAKLDEYLLYEVFKHADPKTLASASCVCKLWYRTSLDERLWEFLCTRHWSTTTASPQRRSVVLALGGFRLFYAHILSKTKPSPPPLLPPSPSTIQPRAVVRSGGGGGSKKDEINLTLSLLSIKYYYDKMNLANKRP